MDSVRKPLVILRFRMQRIFSVLFFGSQRYHRAVSVLVVWFDRQTRFLPVTTFIALCCDMFESKLI